MKRFDWTHRAWMALHRRWLEGRASESDVAVEAWIVRRIWRRHASKTQVRDLKTL